VTKERKGAGLTTTRCGRPCHTSTQARMNNTESILQTFAAELDIIRTAHISNHTQRIKSNNYATT